MGQRSHQAGWDFLRGALQSGLFLTDSVLPSLFSQVSDLQRSKGFLAYSCTLHLYLSEALKQCVLVYDAYSSWFLDLSYTNFAGRQSPTYAGGAASNTCSVYSGLASYPIFYLP